MAPSRTSLTATGIGRAHGAFVVLDDVSIAVGPRSRIGVVGPNGVGKSTLLRILAGLEAPDVGRVARPPPTLTVGYLPQEMGTRAGETLFAHLARRTGVAGAEAELQAASHGLGGSRAEDERYAVALERYLALGAPEFDARAAQMCTRLGLAADRLHVELAALSGGQMARAALAAILLSRFDVLLLDEPTNDLDFAGLAQLEAFVAAPPGGVVVVSHDRAFLEATVDRVVELDEHSRRATEYGGGWLGYLEAKATARRHAEEGYTDYVRQRDELTARVRMQKSWAETGVRSAKRKPTDHDKAQQGWRVNRTEKQAAKVRITEKALERLEVAEKPWEGWDLRLDLAPSTRSGDVVARLTAATVERGSFVLGPVDLEIAWAERVAVTGPNGWGKTTLLRAVRGDLPLASGERYVGPGVVIGSLDQARARFVGGGTLLAAFTDASGVLAQPARSLLAKFGLSADHVERSAAELSPGERTRATLALLMATGANCLVLDEPTNHLDLPAIEQLEYALDRFDGTLLVVSHDRRFLDGLHVTRTIALG